MVVRVPVRARLAKNRLRFEYEKREPRGSRFSYRRSVVRPATRAFPLLIESEAGLYDFGLTRFLHANRYHPRVKPEDMLRSETLYRGSTVWKTDFAAESMSSATVVWVRIAGAAPLASRSSGRDACGISAGGISAGGTGSRTRSPLLTCDSPIPVASGGSISTAGVDTRIAGGSGCIAG